MYKEIYVDNELKCIHFETKVIPVAESNSHYRAYLVWLDEGNTPEEERIYITMEAPQE